MATKKETEGANQTPAANVEEFSRFTWNVRGFNESLTIRCESEEELKQLRDRWSVVINPPRRRIPYMHSGDGCLVSDCNGVLVVRTATNRKTQKPYRFLRCSNHPRCNFTAYIEDEQNTPVENGENGNGHQPVGQPIGQENGHEQRAVTEVAGA